jgi:6-phosphofructokinase 1
MAKRIGILTAGGDVPGQNVCLKTLVVNAADRGYEVLGIRKGWEGLMRYNPEDPTTHADNVIALSKSRVRDVDRMPGSYLHSSRLDPSQVNPRAVPAFFGPLRQAPAPLDLTGHIRRVLDRLQLAGLVVLGDTRALRFAAHLGDQELPVIGIPKSVHNDVPGCDYCLGFSTALGRGVQFVHEVRAMAGSREEIAVVEVLGRTSGLTTMLIALLSGADRTLIPEVPFDPEQLALLLQKDRRMNPNNYAILAMSQGARIAPDKAARYAPELSRQAQSWLLAQLTAAKAEEARAGPEGYTLAGATELGSEVSGSGPSVTEILEHLLDQRLVFQPLSYLIRTGQPDGQDLLGAANFATMAMALLAEGKRNRLTGYRRGQNYVDLPLDTVNQPGANPPVADLYDAAACYPKPGILWAARV